MCVVSLGRYGCFVKQVPKNIDFINIFNPGDKFYEYSTLKSWMLIKQFQQKCFTDDSLRKRFLLILCIKQISSHVPR